jgi:hypothetical protein
VERGRGNALPAELVYLIFHEGDQRRDHEGCALEEKGRKLVADRLSGPGRHDREQVLAFERGAHDGFLALPKGIVAEMAAQGGAGVHARIISQSADNRGSLGIGSAVRHEHCRARILARAIRPSRDRHRGARRPREDDAR